MNKREQSPELIIAAMIGVLEARKSGKIKRGTFLKTWGALRRLLTATRAYQLWHHMVKTRAGGACERCGEIGHHAHHKIPVSRDPRLALDPDNGEYLCKREHNEEHDGKLLRPRRSDARHTHRSPTVHRTHGATQLTHASNPPRSRNQARAARPPNALGGTR